MNATQLRADKQAVTLFNAKLIDTQARITVDRDGAWKIDYAGYTDFYGANCKLTAHLLAA